jgi:hypothetical protein
MIQFDAAPGVPSSYQWLVALGAEEVAEAERRGYVMDKTDPSEPVCRPGIDNCFELIQDSMQDWRARMYVIWFCYIFDHFEEISKPLFAIEEIILEFKAPDLVDLPGKRLGTLYAGAGGAEPVSKSNRARHVEFLTPHHAKAIAMLTTWISGLSWLSGRTKDADLP